MFQRRQDGSVDFYQNWRTYQNGFGPVFGEHWLGNDRIHRLTFQKKYALRVDLWDWDDQSAFAYYSMFYVASRDLDYMLIVGGYSGTAGEFIGLRNHLWLHDILLQRMLKLTPIPTLATLLVTPKLLH